MEVTKGKKNWFFWGALALFTLYQSYRYPFRINAASTSPTYSDTPFALQAGKFVLALPFLIFAAARCVRKPMPLKHWLIACVVFFMFAFSVLKTASGAGVEYLESYWILLSFILVWAADPVTSKDVDRFLQVLLIYSLASNFIEILLFVFLGRLPALAYEGSLSIRFGGFLDDPNGFAALLFLLIGWSYGKFTGWVRTAVLTGLVVSLLLTQSWTGIIFFIGVLFFWSIINVAKRPLRVVFVICTCALLMLVIARNVPYSVVSAFQTMQESKQGSVRGHEFPWAQLAPRWAEWITYGQSTYDPYESWWAGTLVNFGVLWLCMDILLIVSLTVSVQSALSRASEHARPIYRGLLLFGCYFALGSFNLPFSSVFPINVLFFSLSFLVVFGKIQPADYPRENREIRSLS